MKFGKSKITQQMRDAREAALAEMNSHQIALRKMIEALSWVYRWGWSSPTTIDLLSGAKRRGLAAKLVRQGLLKRTKTELGISPGHPGFICTLTEAGRQEVERHRDDLLQYCTDPYKVRRDIIRHDHMVQVRTAKALASGAIAGFITEKELFSSLLEHGSERGIKQPDCVWVFDDGEKMAIEVELSAKWGRYLDEFVKGCIDALQADENGSAKYRMITVISDSPAIIRRYKAAFESGNMYGLWEKVARVGKYNEVKKEKVPMWVERRMVWELIESK